jgi:intracellular sulfur oxidation DsrE/DsrF family protein
MKKIFVFLLVCFTTAQLFAQNKPYNVAFDLTSSDPEVHARVIRWINLITEADPKAKIVVVFYGKSLGMVTKEKSSVTDDIQKIVAANKATFKVCEAAMKVHEISKSNLLPGVQTVPDGIYELVKKQAEGYGYIKVAN